LSSHGFPLAGGEILNIGDGLGDIGSALKQEASGGVLALDLSPRLIDYQKARGSADRYYEANAINLPFGEDTFTGVISNEVIADLPAVRSNSAQLVNFLTACDALGISKAQGLQKMFDERRINPADQQVWFSLLNDYLKYKLVRPDINKSTTPETILTNTGVFRLLEELSRVLTPGGQVWLSEYGSLEPDYWKSRGKIFAKDPLPSIFSKKPTIETQGAHEEFPIKFSHLLQVAGSLGFTASAIPLINYLGIDPEQWCVSVYTDKQGYKLVSPEEASRLGLGQNVYWTIASDFDDKQGARDLIQRGRRLGMDISLPYDPTLRYHNSITKLKDTMINQFLAVTLVKHDHK
jgi:SAM-dependent methyltransferase